MDLLCSVSQYLSHIFVAGGRHHIHSPFVYELYDKAIKVPHVFYAYDEVETERQRLIADKKQISVTDLGAGSGGTRKKLRKVGDIASKAAKPPKLAQLLFRLSWYLKPATIVELGTSFGLTTSYLSRSAPEAKIITLEGCPNNAQIAQEVFRRLQIKNIDLIIGNIDDNLPIALNRSTSLDMIFIDANHAYEPTIRYFNMFLKHIHEGSLMVIDDIYWSKGMRMAWKEIKAHPEVMLTIDLYYLGLVFFRKNAPKQHFQLKV